LIWRSDTGRPLKAIAEDASGEKHMQVVKGAIVLATIIAAVAVGACRREVPHEPMKLGAGDIPAPTQVAR
jgi:hypothetical protein